MSRAACGGLGFGVRLDDFLGWRAIKANKCGAPKKPFKRAVTSGFMDATFDTAHGISRTPFGAKGRTTCFGLVSKSIV